MVQAAHMYLCHAVLWDFDGLWQWLMVARDALVSAIACYGSNSQLQEVIAIQRQGIFHNHICLPDCGGALAQPMREFTDQLMDSEFLLDSKIGTTHVACTLVFSGCVKLCCLIYYVLYDSALLVTVGAVVYRTSCPPQDYACDLSPTRLCL